MICPPNPFYVKQFVASMSCGHAVFNIPAPGGNVPPQDAIELIEFMELIIRQLRRDSEKSIDTPTTEAQHERD